MILWNSKVEVQKSILRSGTTIFRNDELAWLKISGMGVLDRLLRLVVVVMGGVYWSVLASAKGSWLTVEAVLPLLFLYWGSSGLLPSRRIACSGDWESSYLNRVCPSSKSMKGAMGELDEVMPNSLELPSKNYHYWFNGDKIAWIASTWLYDLFMVVVAVVLYAYRYLVLNYSLSIDEFPLQNYLRVLSFENEAHSTVAFWSLIMAVLALVASALTFKAGVVVCSSGGVRDEFALSKKDRQKMYSFLENSRSSPLASSSKEAVAKIDKKTSKLVAKQKKKELQSAPRSSKTDSSSQTGDLESVTKPSASKPSSLSHSEDLALDGELKEDRPTVLPPSESLPEVSLGEDEKEGRLTIEAPITSSSDEAEEP